MHPPEFCGFLSYLPSRLEHINGEIIVERDGTGGVHFSSRMLLDVIEQFSGGDQKLGGN